MFRKSAAVSSLALVTALASLPVLSGQRAFVASFGNDANGPAGCNLVAPCRTFQVAHTAVNAGGEIVALDAAGYAPVTITKSVTITANPGFFAGIAASSGNAVTIATPAIEVILRGLNINGIGANYGVFMTDGASLSIENCVISAFVQDGVQVFANANVRVVNTLVRGNGGSGMWFRAGVTADVSNSKILDNGWVGIWSNPDTMGSTFVAVSDTVASGNTWGFSAPITMGATSKMTIIRSTASDNNTGIQSDGGTITVGYSMVSGNSVFGLLNNGGALESMGNNLVRANGTNTSGVITSAPGI